MKRSQEAKPKTERQLVDSLVRACAKAGYNRVAINCMDKRIKACRGWPFEYQGSVFASPDVMSRDGWPVIWQIVRDVGIDSGCGNSNQHNISGISSSYKWSRARGLEEVR